jgi:hypothetical protein
LFGRKNQRGQARTGTFIFAPIFRSSRATSTQISTYNITLGTGSFTTTENDSSIYNAGKTKVSGTLKIGKVKPR